MEINKCSQPMREELHILLTDIAHSFQNFMSFVVGHFSVCAPSQYRHMC